MTTYHGPYLMLHRLLLSRQVEASRVESLLRRPFRQVLFAYRMLVCKSYFLANYDYAEPIDGERVRLFIVERGGRRFCGSMVVSRAALNAH